MSGLVLMASPYVLLSLVPTIIRVGAAALAGPFIAVVTSRPYNRRDFELGFRFSADSSRQRADAGPVGSTKSFKFS